MDVLLVEDDPMIVSALAGLLEGEGYRVRAVGRQDEAVAALAETTFDLALLDVTLAQGNGFAVCAAAREAHSSMPVIFLTASDDEFSTVAGLDMGAVDYIAKPFSLMALRARVEAALAHPRGAAHLRRGEQRACRWRRAPGRGVGYGDEGRARGVPLGARVQAAALPAPEQGTAHHA